MWVKFKELFEKHPDWFCGIAVFLAAVLPFLPAVPFEVFVIGGKAGDKAETVYEIADLTYHVMVLMLEMGISLEDIHKELASRHIIDHKVKQEKMTK